MKKSGNRRFFYVLIIFFQSFSFSALINVILIPTSMRAISTPNILPIEIFSAMFTRRNQIFLLSQCHDTSSFHHHFQAIEHPAGTRHRRIDTQLLQAHIRNRVPEVQEAEGKRRRRRPALQVPARAERLCRMGREPSSHSRSRENAV